MVVDDFRRIETKVLAGLCYEPTIEIASQAVKLEYKFFSPEYRTLFLLLKRHFLRYSQPTKSDHFITIIENTKSSVESKKELSARYLKLRSQAVKLEPWDIETLARAFDENQVVNVISNAIQAMKGGISINGRLYSGPEDARAILENVQTPLPQETDMDPCIAYDRIQSVGQRTTYPVGVCSQLVEGFQAGEEWVIAGFAGDGKTTLMLNCVRDLALSDTKAKVAILSLETPSFRLYWKLMSQQAASEHKNLKYDDIRYGRLSAVQRSYLSDLYSRIKKQIYIKSVPVRMGAYQLGGYSRMVLKEFDYDVLVVDYVGLAARGNSIEQLGDIFVQQKGIALRYDKVVLLLHQTNREGWKLALKSGYYTITAMSDTNYAERTADGIMWILKYDFLKSRIGLCKVRDTPTDYSKTIELELDPDKGLFKDSAPDSLKSLGRPNGKWDGKVPI